MNKKGPLMYCHLGIMALLLLVNALFAIVLLAGLGSSSDIAQETVRLHDSLRGSFYILSAVVIVFGILYIVNEYSKPAANYYKTFLFLYAASSLLLAVIDMVLVETTFVSISRTPPLARSSLVSSIT